MSVKQGKQDPKITKQINQLQGWSQMLRISQYTRKVYHSFKVAVQDIQPFLLNYGVVSVRIMGSEMSQFRISPLE